MEIIERGWRTSSIQSAIKLGSKGIPSIDSLEDIDHLINDKEAANETNQLPLIYALTAKELYLVVHPTKRVKMTMTIAIGNESTSMEHSMPSRTSLINSLLWIVGELLLMFSV